MADPEPPPAEAEPTFTPEEIEGFIEKYFPSFTRPLWNDELVAEWTDRTEKEFEMLYRWYREDGLYVKPMHLMRTVAAAILVEKRKADKITIQVVPRLREEDDGEAKDGWRYVYCIGYVDWELHLETSEWFSESVWIRDDMTYAVTPTEWAPLPLDGKGIGSLPRHPGSPEGTVESDDIPEGGMDVAGIISHTRIDVEQCMEEVRKSYGIQ